MFEMVRSQLVRFTNLLDEGPAGSWDGFCRHGEAGSWVGLGGRYLSIKYPPYLEFVIVDQQRWMTQALGYEVG